MLLRLLLFALLAYLVWRILESALRLTGRQNSRDSLKDAARMPRKKPDQPFRDIRDAEFEDLTPKKKDEDNPPSTSS